MSRAFTAANDDLREPAIACIEKVRERGYGTVAEFGRDLRECLAVITIRNEGMADRDAAMDAWRAALHRLTESHWTRYQFDAEAELAGLSA